MPIELGDSWFLPKLAAVKSRVRQHGWYRYGLVAAVPKGIIYLSNSKCPCVIELGKRGSWGKLGLREGNNPDCS